MTKPKPRPVEITPGQCRASRTLLGWTQAELAERSGVSAQTIFNFESGGNRPQAATMARLVNALTDAGITFVTTHGTVGIEPPA